MRVQNLGLIFCEGYAVKYVQFETLNPLLSDLSIYY